MSALQDITNRNKCPIFVNNRENIILTTPDTTSFTTRRVPVNRAFYLRSNSSRRVRFPSRLSLDSSSTGSCSPPPPDFKMYREVDCGCSSLNSSYDCINFDSYNGNLDKCVQPKKKFLSRSVSDGGRKMILNKFSTISKNQIAELVNDVSRINISAEKKCLTPIDRLHFLFQNILRAMPDRVYGSTRDAVSYKRVEIHLLVFKQECLRQCRILFNDSLWEALFEYIFMSSRIVEQLPQWENTSHNLHREQIFIIMASYCRKAFKLADFDAEATRKLRHRVTECCEVNSHMAKVFNGMNMYYSTQIIQNTTI